MTSSVLAALFLFAARPAAAADGDPAPTAAAPSAQSQFELLKARMLQQKGVSLDKAGVTLPTIPAVPPPGPKQPPPDWNQAEQERQAEFDRQFGGGAYKNLTDFSRTCEPPECNFLATADIIRGAYDFVDLKRDVESKRVAEGSAAFARREGTIKSNMRQTLDEMRPQPGGDPKKQEELIRVSDPIVKKVFTPAELVDYAKRNASSADTAPYYSFLGRTLNGVGQPGPAREAFDAALARDSRNEAALSGRAEASYRLGDYAAAIRDARTALVLDPTDANALTTLNFSKERVPPGAPAVGSLPAGAPADDAAAPAPGLSRSPPLPAGPQAAGDPRGDSQVAEARRRLRLGDARGAAAALDRALALDPSNPAALSLSAVVRIRLKDYQGALAAAEAGLKLAPGNAALWDSKAFALNRMKDHRGALAAADRALSLNANDPVAYFNRAVALRGLGDKTGMTVALQRAAALDPKFAPVLEAALRLPSDADLLYLFPGESPSAEPAPLPEIPRPAWQWVVAGVLGGLTLAALLVLLLRRAEPAPAPVAPRLSSRRHVPTRLAGKYEVGRELGSGGMGVVYEGFDASLGRPVAIKRLREELRWDPKETARFLAEARLVARLKHPNIVEVYAVVDEGGELFVVFERVEGTTLDDLLHREKRLRLQRARDLFRGVCAALGDAHRHAVIHRDLKPANIMIESSGRARVMDFGIARSVEDAVSRVTRTVSGTPLYMAPEQEQGVARRESDLFAAAVCLYEAVTGRRPFEGAGLTTAKLRKSFTPASAVVGKASPGLDEFFSRALEPDPEKRFATADEFLRALESLDAA